MLASVLSVGGKACFESRCLALFIHYSIEKHATVTSQVALTLGINGLLYQIRVDVNHMRLHWENNHVKTYQSSIHNGTMDSHQCAYGNVR